MLKQLQGQHLIALDTESNSLFRYYPKVCLIQLTTFEDPHNPDPNAVLDYLIDPLALAHLQPLGELLQNPAVEIVMHAADNDILILQRDFNFEFQTIFDTQLAARILGWKQIGLAVMLQEHFGVVSDKRMQRTDWGRRPLTPQQIMYAQTDTHYLPALRARMVEELKAADRWEEAQEAFSMLRLIDYSEREPTQRSFWQMR
ncbi:MAG: ribonuclease D, partial [Caldilineaceae bacterium]|nr:ribonuclease D [Caldilineaceae bacterium]